MGIAAGPYNSRDGLVLWYDMGNIKSFRGEPVTNFFTNGHFSGGSGIPGENGSNPTNDIIVFPNPGDSQWVLRQTGPGQFTEYQISLTSQLTASTTYVMSGWYAESSDYQGADGSRMFHARAFSSTGAHQATGNGIGTVITTTVIGGIVWKYCYQTITTPSNYSNQFDWYLGYGGSTFSGNRYYTNIQMEVGTYPKSFSNGTRGTTVATGGGIIDLSGRSNNAELVNGPTYSSSLGGLVSFDGTNDHFLLPNGVLSGTGDFTIIQFLRGGGASIGTTFANYPSGNLQLFFGTNYIGMWLGNSSTYLGVSPWNTQLSQYTTSPVMIAAVRSGTTTQFWINDKIEKTGTSSFSIGTTSSQFRIGTNTSGGEAFSGSIFNTQVYNRALSSDEVIQAYNSLRTRFITRSSIVTNGLVLHLDAGNFSSYKGSGTVWNDLSGYGNHATLINGPKFRGANGGNVVLDGVNDYVVVPHNSIFNFGTGPFTIMLVVASDQLKAYTAYIKKGGPTEWGNSPAGWYATSGNGGGDFSWYWVFANGSSHTEIPPSPSFGKSNDTFGLNFFSISRDASGNIHRSWNGSYQLVATGWTGNFDNTSDIWIGRGNVNYLNGRCSCVYIYNVALTEQQVLQNYNATKSRFGL